MKINYKLGIPLTLMLLTLSACGFHLRGAVHLPDQMARTYVQGIGPYDEFGRGLRRALEAAGATLVETPESATAILVILENVADRRVLSVRSSGKVQEYELFHRLRFTLKDAKGQTLQAPQQLEVTREYLYDQNDPLASGGEETTIRKEMDRDLIQLVMLRLQAAGRQP